MTMKETGILEKLRNELHSYHIDILTLTGRVDRVFDDIEKLNVDIYGTPDDRTNNPGALSRITSLCGSRKRMLIGLSCAWSVLLLIVGAIVKYFIF